MTKRFHFSIYIFALLMITTSSIAQSSEKIESAAVVIPVNWYKIHLDSTLRSTFFKAEKIDKNKSVFLKITNYNYIRYNLDHEVQEEVIESYRVLENLWDQVFSYIPPTTKDFPGYARNPFLESLKTWRRDLAKRERQLDKYIRKFSDNIHVTDDEIAVLEAVIEDTSTRDSAIGIGVVDDLEKSRQRTEDLIFDSENIAVTVFDSIMIKGPKEREILAKIEALRGKTTSKNTATDAYYAFLLYERQLQIHEQVIKKFKAFFAAGRKTYRGSRIKIASKESGTLVTVTMIPVGIKNKHIEIANRTQPVSVQYFVQSDNPVVFHIGYVLTFLENREFEKIQTLAGNDVFTLVRDEDYSQDLSAFLSLEIHESNDDQWGIALTLGTDVASPGDKIYLGPSIKFCERWFITAAFVNSEVVNGINKVSGNEEIKLYESIKTSKEWGFVLGISLSPF